MPIELVFVIGIAVLLFLCLKVKANAFMALLATALVMGMLSGLGGPATVKTITSGFAGTVKSIGIVIIFGILLGNYLDAAKGTNRMAIDAVRLVGQKRASLAMAITGYLVSIPVFSDAACVILAPLVKAIHRKTGIPLAVLAVSLSGGLLATHVYVPPTPGPLAAAGLLGIDIGQAILWGAFAAVFMTAAGWIFAETYLRSRPECYYHFQPDAQKEEEAAFDDNTDDLPGTLASLIPLVIPLLLIVGNTTAAMLLPKKHPLLAVTSFIGDANIALAIGALLAILTLGKRMGGRKGTENHGYHPERRRAHRIHHLCRRGIRCCAESLRSWCQPGPDGHRHRAALHLDPVCHLWIAENRPGQRHRCRDHRCHLVCSHCQQPGTESHPDLPGFRSWCQILLPRERLLLLGVYQLYGL